MKRDPKKKPRVGDEFIGLPFRSHHRRETRLVVRLYRDSVVYRAHGSTYTMTRASFMAWLETYASVK